MVVTRQYLGMPTSMVLDNLNVHLVGQLAGFVTENADRLRVVRLTVRVSERNPARGCLGAALSFGQPCRHRSA
ncbi:hypothetical protein ACWEJ6_49675 [Nonomuraea sp. NPDC004702]